MTEDEFLARCRTAYQMGLVNPARLQLMERYIEVVMREGHSRVWSERGRHDTLQWDIVHQFWKSEMDRIRTNSPADRPLTLANDDDAYVLMRFAAVLSHPCQKCAVDPKAWHTRSAFCNHKRGVSG